MLISFMLWGSIIFKSATSSSEETTGLYIASTICIAIVPIIYLINALSSPVCCYFINETKITKINPIMDKIFDKKPKITMHVECFHYEAQKDTFTDLRGIVHKAVPRQRVVTHSATKEVQYKSWRDISGHIMLDNKQMRNGSVKAFARLELRDEIFFANDGTSEDFEKERREFKEKHKKDVEQEYTESFVVYNFPNEMDVHVTDTLPCFLNCCYMVIFTFLGAFLCYRQEIDAYWADQSVVIQKVISTRTDLHSPSENTAYAYYDPRITVGRKTTQFFPDQNPTVLRRPPGEVPFYMGPPPSEVPFVSINKDKKPSATNPNSSHKQPTTLRIVPMSERDQLYPQQPPRPPTMYAQGYKSRVFEADRQKPLPSNVPMPVPRTASKHQELPPEKPLPEERLPEDSHPQRAPAAEPPRKKSHPQNQIQSQEEHKQAPEHKELDPSSMQPSSGYSQFVPNYQQPFSGYQQHNMGYQQPPILSQQRPIRYQQVGPWYQPPPPGPYSGSNVVPYPAPSIEEIDHGYSPQKTPPPGESHRAGDMNTSHLPLQYGQH